MHIPNVDMLVDVVDRQNQAIGIATRKDVLPAKQNFRTVHAILTTSSGALVLQLLPASHLRSPNRFGSSVAGYLHSGETYAQGIRRKLREELHIVIDEGLNDLGEVAMDDEGSTKFVGVYAASIRSMPSFNATEIAALVILPIPTVDSLVTENPNLFTRTFMHVYRRYRERVQP